MKICLLSRYFDIGANAGLGRIATEVSRRLEERGHDVVKVSSDDRNNWRYAWNCLHGLKKRIPTDCDVYHALSPMEALHIPKLRAVVTFNDLIPLTHPELAGAGMQVNRLGRAIGWGMFAYFTRRALACRRVIAISSQTASDISAMRMNTRLALPSIDVVRLGIRPDLEPQQKPDDIFRVGYIGQLDPRKRVDLLINAFRQTDINGECVIAGTGRQEAELRALAGDDPRIKFLGFIPDDELVQFYNSLDLFVFPTAIEGYGLPPVEAMACGVPVVIMSDAIMPDDVKRHCFQTESIRDLLEMWPVLEIKGMAVFEKFAQSHDWERTVDAYEQIYREVAS